MKKRSLITNGQGKTDLPRPTNRDKYETNYVLIFGAECIHCEGRGYYLEYNEAGKPFENKCLVCNGTGRVNDISKLNPCYGGKKHE